MEVSANFQCLKIVTEIDLSYLSQAKKALVALNRKSKIDEEITEQNTNNVALEIHREKQAKARKEAQQFWQQQLQATAEQRQIEKDAEAVLKQKISV